MDDVLILIPCCKTKTVVPSRNSGHCSPFCLESSRSGLVSRIRETPEIAERRENLAGVFDEEGTSVRAFELYNGHFYQKAHSVLHEIAGGAYPFIHLFIVSALYGLVDLNEPLKIYDLKMGDRLHDGQPVWKYWKEEDLSGTVEDYVKDHTISHVWSLLPDSKPHYPYHQVFEEFWENAQDMSVRCIHVMSPGARSGSGARRAAWLLATVTHYPGHLYQEDIPFDQSRAIAGHDYLYRRC